MSDADVDKPFAAERAKTGRAKCKKCKCPIEKDTVRIAKLVANPFSDGKMKAWHHASCLFEVFAKQRATTKRIDDPAADIDGWEDLSPEDRSSILRRIEEFENSSPFGAPGGEAGRAGKKRKSTAAEDREAKRKPGTADRADSSESSTADANGQKTVQRSPVKSADDSFLEFRKLCAEVARVDAYTEKTALVRRALTTGSEGDGFKGDPKLWCRLLLPGVDRRVYNLQSKQLVKLFSRMLLQDEDEMLGHLERGDVADTVREFFEKSVAVEAARESRLTIQEVDGFLETLSGLTREDDQVQHFRSILSRCTAEDLKMIIRLIKHDLRINAGPKHILAAVHEDAYQAFQTSRDLNNVIDRCWRGSDKTGKSLESDSKVALALMTPVLPMLAEPCKSIDMAMKKCPHGMLAEVKYDGERVQVHKSGDEFRYFSRSLKPVLAHKVNLFKEHIPEAFPDGDDLILDAEVLMIDTKTGQPLPFGSLGIHKKAEFKDANVCLFVFDCIYYNGDVLLNKSMMERRRILSERMTEIPNRIMLSEVEKVHDPRDLARMIAKVFKLGLEGLVLKDVSGKYEPGKRHWLKVKKDYLFDGAMADSADLVVLGAWYGTGNKGGMMSIFLMGCYDEDHGVWVTVTKVHTGHDDATLASLQDSLDMIKIGKDPSKLPPWLWANKPMVPDFIARDPKKQPVWEITGAEFTNQGVHTADGISVRFPRVTRIRHDKDWSTATSLRELRRLFEQRSTSMDLSLLLPATSNDLNESEKPAAQPIASPSAKRRSSPSKTSLAHSPKKSRRKRSSSSLNPQEGTPPERKQPTPKEISNPETPSTNPMDEQQPQFYSFVNKHYIEYSSTGTPLNWINGHRPPDGLPSDARPLSNLTDDELKSRTILRGVAVSLSPGFSKRARKSTVSLLKTLGAKFTESRGKSSYVVHPDEEIPSSRVHEYEDAARTARHVNVSWAEASAAAGKIQPSEAHAVELAADYCSCPCRHR